MSLFGKPDKDKKRNPLSAPLYASLVGAVFIAIAVILVVKPAADGINWGPLCLYATLGVFLLAWGIYMFVKRSRAVTDGTDDGADESGSGEEKDGPKVYHAQKTDKNSEDKETDE